MNEYSFIYQVKIIQEVAMTKKINTAAVIGAGIMGGGIAALLAGVGIKTLLLDIVPFDLKDEEKNDPIARNRVAKAGLDTTLMTQPPLFMHFKDVDRITIGNMDDDFHRLEHCVLPFSARSCVQGAPDG